jgi:hypothetical protein
MKSFSHGFYDEYKIKVGLKIDDEGFTSIKLAKKYGLAYDFKLKCGQTLTTDCKWTKFYSIENIRQCVNEVAKNYNAFELLNVDNDNFFFVKDKLLVEIYQLSKLLAMALTNTKIKYISFD